MVMAEFGIDIDDGYTDEVRGVKCRRLTCSERAYVTEMVQAGAIPEMESWLFRRPHVGVSCPDYLDEDEKNHIFAHVMTWKTEEDDLNNLVDGVELLCTRPLLALRSCEQCHKWWFDTDTDKIVRMNGEAILRPDHVKVACDVGVECPKGHHSAPLQFTERNRKTWEMYLEYHRVGCPHPGDALFRRHWNIIDLIVSKHGLPHVCERVYQESRRR